jgi:hypothetical protein
VVGYHLDNDDQTAYALYILILFAFRETSKKVSKLFHAVAKLVTREIQLPALINKTQDKRARLCENIMFIKAHKVLRHENNAQKGENKHRKWRANEPG